MNAAAKTIHQYHLFNGKLAKMRLSWQSYLHIALLSIVLASSIAVVYTTNLYRTTLNQLELAKQHTHTLNLQWGQLLLEQASLLRSERLAERAADKLHMVLPTSKQTLILHGKA